MARLLKQNYLILLYKVDYEYILICFRSTMNVFRKTSDLSFPPLPKPPNIEQMTEDIKQSDANDPIYLGKLKCILLKLKV